MHKYFAKLILLLALVSSFSFMVCGQDKVSGWDNQLYFGNKISWGKDKWRFSGDIQFRFKENVGKLDVYFAEFVSTYLVNKRFEIVPDIRVSRKPGQVEFRPGLGFIYKHLAGKVQLIHQVKWQMDFGTDNQHSQAVRYVFFINYKPFDKWIFSGVLGTFGEFSSRYSGWMGIRTGIGAAYIFDKLHTINFGYYYGLFNQKNGSFTNLGIVNFQLIINITKDYRYVPAKYYMF